MRLTMIISQLGPGGAERVFSTLASHWADRGCDITVVTFVKADADFYPLSTGVQRSVLGTVDAPLSVPQMLTAVPRRVGALRNVFRRIQPEVVISFMDTTNILTLLATRGTTIPVVISERTDPAQHRIGAVRSWARRRIYRLAHAIVVPSRGVARWVEKTFVARCSA